MRIEMRKHDIERHRTVRSVTVRGEGSIPADEETYELYRKDARELVDFAVRAMHLNPVGLGILLVALNEVIGVDNYTGVIT